MIVCVFYVMQSGTLVLTIKKLWFPNKSVNANCLRLRSKHYTV